MSNLTKIFIVLQLVFSIVLTVMTVLVLGAQAPLRDQLKVEAAARVAQAAENQSLKNALAAAQTGRATAQQGLEKEIARLAGLNEGLTTKLQAAEARAQTFEAQNAEATATGVRLSATVESLRAQLATKDTELGTVRPKLVDLTRQNAELVRANNELTSEGEARLQAIKALKEELTAVRQKAEKTTTSDAGTQLNAAPAAAVQINGRVQKVEDVNGRTYVTLTLGTRDGVQNGMRFTIYRKDSFVADAIVQRVVPDQAVAVVTTTRQAVQGGDLAISGGGL